MKHSENIGDMARGRPAECYGPIRLRLDRDGVACLHAEMVQYRFFERHLAAAGDFQALFHNGRSKANLTYIQPSFASSSFPGAREVELGHVRLQLV